MKGILSPRRKPEGQKVIRAVGHAHTHRGVRDAEMLLFPEWKERKNPGKSTKRPSFRFWLKAEQGFPSWVKFGVMSLDWLWVKRENYLKTFIGGFGKWDQGQSITKMGFFQGDLLPLCTVLSLFGRYQKEFSGGFEKNF